MGLLGKAEAQRAGGTGVGDQLSLHEEEGH